MFKTKEISKLPFKPLPNYDFVAPFYNLLSSLVFGNAILQAQDFLLRTIPANSTILIVGGGSGQILESLARIHPMGLHITYVEPSKKMIDLSKRKNIGKNKVIFIQQFIQEATLLHKFDVVITPFLFDNFLQNTAGRVFYKLDASLKLGGIWLYADFKKYNNNWWQKGLLKIMYLFFQIVCNIEASRLPDTESLFKKGSYRISTNCMFFKNFIESSVYVKSFTFAQTF